MAISSRSLLSIGLVGLCALIPTASTLAHPPFAPYDDTRFAAITSFGPSVGVEVAADGLTAPLKGVTAPGQPNRLYVVDQPGILWAVNLTDGTKTVFLDVRQRLVTLGACGPNTFDERGLLGLAFHPNYATNGLIYTYTSEPEVGRADVSKHHPSRHRGSPERGRRVARAQSRQPGVGGGSGQPARAHAGELAAIQP